ncbi:MAG: VOC family protein [Gaiellales bacterium]
MVRVRYLVDDVAAAEQFYVEHLGFARAVQLGVAVRVVERDGISLWLTATGSSAAKRHPNGIVPRPGGWNRIVVQVDDLAGLLQHLTELGHHEDVEQSSGVFGIHAVVHDPSGNPVELFQPVAE